MTHRVLQFSHSISNARKRKITVSHYVYDKYCTQQDGISTRQRRINLKGDDRFSIILLLLPTLYLIGSLLKQLLASNGLSLSSADSLSRVFSISPRPLSILSSLSETSS